MKICLQIYLEGKTIGKKSTPFLHVVNMYDTSAADYPCTCCEAEGGCVKLFNNSFQFKVSLRDVAHWFVVRMAEINTVRGRRERKSGVEESVHDNFVVGARQLYILGRALMIAKETNTYLKVPSVWHSKCICANGNRKVAKVSQMTSAGIGIVYGDKVTIPSAWCEKLFGQAISWIWQRITPDLELISTLESAASVMGDLLSSKTGQDIMRSVKQEESSWDLVESWVKRILLFLTNTRLKNCLVVAQVKDETPALRQGVKLAHNNFKP